MVQAYEPSGHLNTENRRLLRTDQVEIILAKMAQGGAAQGHIHKTTDQIVFTLGRTASGMKDDRLEETGPDTLLHYIPAGTFHGGAVPLNRTDKTLSLLVIYAPPLDPSDIFPAEDDGSGNSGHRISFDQAAAYQTILKAGTEVRRLLRTKTLEINLNQVANGGAIEEHTHALNDQILYVIHGVGSFVIDQEPIEIEPGMLAFIPRGAPHGGKAPTSRMDSILKYLVIYTPALGASP
jgi:quercetin dioxygenase-like cupin family protein